MNTIIEIEKLRSTSDTKMLKTCYQYGRKRSEHTGKYQKPVFQLDLRDFSDTNLAILSLLLFSRPVLIGINCAVAVSDQTQLRS